MDEKLKFLTDILGATDIDIARRAELPKETMSRLKAGTRVLKRNSRQLEKLVNGIYLYAEEKKMRKRLRIAIGCSAADEAGIRMSLLNWFVEGEIPQKTGLKKLPKTKMPRHQSEGDMSLFGNRLKALMEMAGISNAGLAQQTGVSEKYISRLRGSMKPPGADTDTFQMLSRCLTHMITEQGKAEQLSELTEIPERLLLSPQGENYVWEYLGWSGDYSAKRAINAFITTLRTAPNSGQPVLPEPALIMEGIPGETAEYYRGREGLREAVLRFLADGIRKGHKELWLYSDQSMDWMQGDYAVKWFVLMQACLKNGAKIKIIHNIDRELPEMLSAINFWMPLYLSGHVEAYYSTKNPGERFSNTIFGCPDACIRGTCYAGDEAFCRYDYHTDREALDFDRETFDRILEDSEPLLRYQNSPTHMSGQFHIRNLDDIEICVGSKSVVINKLSEPFLSFVFFHELMINAFKEYVGKRK